MAYVTREDVILYIQNIIQFQAGDDTPVRLILFKDYLNTQLDLSTVDSITVTLFDDVGRRVLTFLQPLGPGASLPITTYETGTGKEGYIEFIIPGAQNIDFHPGDVYATVGLVWANYYPEPKTITTPKIKCAFITGSQVPTPQLPNNVIGQAGPPGQDGGNGNDVLINFIFKRASSQPSTPSGGTFNFSTQIIN